MVERSNRINGSTFMGCTRFPDCTETAKVPAWLEVKRAGGLELPGLEEI
jgi:ssDNA-binding Zn-finger/Zn-ribbon topoisomerase 1